MFSEKDFLVMEKRTSKAIARGNSKEVRPTKRRKNKAHITNADLIFEAMAALRTSKSAHQSSLRTLVRNPCKLAGNQEHYEQVLIFAILESKNQHAYHHLYSVPNGGHRTLSTASKLKAEGVKSGVLDLSLDIPAGIYHGLKIELKAEGKKPAVSVNQKLKMNELTELGYRVVLAIGHKQALREIELYHKLYKALGFDNKTTLDKCVNYDYWGK